ncbi:MAG: hypothetical protein ACK55I_16960, partial [bacterium]
MRQRSRVRGLGGHDHGRAARRVRRGSPRPRRRHGGAAVEAAHDRPGPGAEREDAAVAAADPDHAAGRRGRHRADRDPD